jgi:hypothetical protein
LRVKHPLVCYLESNKRMLNYRNVRRRAEERVCAMEARVGGARAAGAKDVGWNLSREAENVY